MQPGYNINDLYQEAQTRWLKPVEVMYILQNHVQYQITQETPQQPPSGSLFLFNKRVLRFFRKDGHNWRKKRDGRTVGEAHERLKVGNVEALNCYYAHGEQNPTFQRRSYWMLDPAYEHIALVHYRETSENSDAANNSISSTSNFSQGEIWDPPTGDGGSTYGHVASNRVTKDEDDDHDGDRDLSAVKEDDDSTSEITDFSRWEKGQIIGAGGYGTVYVAHNRETRALCAVKELKDIHKLGNIESIQKEIKILSQLDHPNIVKYYGHEIVGCHISLYMEYIQPCSLKKYILEQGALHEPLIQIFTAQILSGLVYLHSKRVVHRDIKPDNLLVDSNNIVKLAGFGLAEHLGESIGNHSILGTPYYAAPEVLRKKEYKSSREAYAADIWSLGCVIIEMFSGKHPWPGFDLVQAFYNVSVKEQRPPILEEMCGEGKDFVKRCFTRTPAKRPSAAALLDHPFVKSLSRL